MTIAESDLISRSIVVFANCTKVLEFERAICSLVYAIVIDKRLTKTARQKLKNVAQKQRVSCAIVDLNLVYRDYNYELEKSNCFDVLKQKMKHEVIET